MSKKMKVLVSVLVAILLLTIGGTTLAMAQEEEEVEPEDELTTEEEIMPDVGTDRLLARVAEILGISEEELREAFRQAREEVQDERFEKALYQMLDKAVEEEILAPEEAEEIKEWWEQRPEALTPGLLQRAFWAMYPRPKPMPGNRFGNRPETKLHLQQRLGQLSDPEVRQKVLEKALEKGLISQEEVEAIKEWLESRPEVSNGLAPRARIFNAFRNRQQIAVPKGWQGQMPGEVEG